ncbi:MAG: ferrous iron transport protein B [Bacillota bacterium]|nr:ferrous iron transport protein B [Bacillota bacterium]
MSEALQPYKENEWVIALAGNPNVGKSTVFNLLTGMKQHTSNWPGKTVDVAEGYFDISGKKCRLVDLPGTYSLVANSEDETLARDFICFGKRHTTLIVADATALERNLNLVLQTMEITDNAVLCVNLIDEAIKKHIHININKLEKILGIPVAATSARSNKGVDVLLEIVEKRLERGCPACRLTITEYSKEIEKAIMSVSKHLPENAKINRRWIALKLLEGDIDIINKIEACAEIDLRNKELSDAIEAAERELLENGIDKQKLTDMCVSEMVHRAQRIAEEVTVFDDMSYDKRDRKIDKILTSKRTGIPIMMLLLAGIFWITVTGANYPSQVLSKLFFAVEEQLYIVMKNAPPFLTGILITGMYHTLAWVVSVMLPPMAIFFPLFAILEDLGYLPRVAFNLDACFKKAHAHGKQVLTMCQGFGCNACGVMGCRIINSPRERLIAILTNNFVPCNGRFPTIIVLIAIFFSGFGGNLASSAMLLLVIIIGVAITLLVSRILSVTILKGVPSSFTLELPPYRRPQFEKIIVRSFIDRTLFVLRRAVVVAIPAGAIIWLMANLTIGNTSLLSHCTTFLDPLGKLLGMDGYILTAFLLGFPANEIVIPLLLMGYTASGQMTEYQSAAALGGILKANGWTWVTAACVIIFSLMHFPCATTCQTIYKETKSLGWTIFAIIMPTITGMAVCFIISSLAKLFL